MPTKKYFHQNGLVTTAASLYEIQYNLTESNLTQYNLTYVNT